ncbi:MAG: histidine phosphatase family protein [Bdellovibrionales bacterium]|jgi:broad specificity phosphatase PhoE|nr:histidine phosphatase family protein [Bdellovibrionales bacterium]
MIEFYLFRHGETDWNLAGRMQGSADIPLNETGVQQAEALRLYFDELRKDGVTEWFVSSPLQRARETARIALRISGNLNVPQEPRFAETHMGHAEGMTREELVANYGEEIWLSWIDLGKASWQARFPGGESKGEVRDRALAAMSDLALQALDDGHVHLRIFVATHGGLLRRLLHHFHPELKQPISVENGAVFQFVHQQGLWRVDVRPVFEIGS